MKFYYKLSGYRRLSVYRRCSRRRTQNHSQPPVFEALQRAFAQRESDPHSHNEGKTYQKTPPRGACRPRVLVGTNKLLLATLTGDRQGEATHVAAVAERANNGDAAAQ